MLKVVFRQAKIINIFLIAEGIINIFPNLRKRTPPWLAGVILFPLIPQHCLVPALSVSSNYQYNIESRSGPLTSATWQSGTTTMRG